MGISRFQWIFIVVCGLGAFGYEAVRLLRVEPQYAATATIQLHPPGLFEAETGGEKASDRSVRRYLTTAVELINRTDLMETVIGDTGLMANPRFNTLGVENDSAEDVNQMARRLASQTSGKVRSSTFLLDLTVQHEDTRLAVDLANWVAYAYVARRRLDDQQIEFQKMSALTNRLAESEAKLKNVETELLEYRKKLRIVVSIEEREKKLSERVASLTAQSNVLEEKRRALQESHDRFTELGDEATLEALRVVPAVRDSKQVHALESELENLRLIMEDRRRRHADPKHPEVVSTSKDYEARKTEYETLVRETPNRVARELEVRNREAEQLNATLESEGEALLNLAAQAIDYGVMTRNLEDARSEYEELAAAVRDRQTATLKIQKDAEVVEEASTAETLTTQLPSRKFEYGLGGLGGGLLLVYLFNNFLAGVQTRSPSRRR